MALNLTLDFSIPILDEPGFGRRLTSREISVRGNTKGDSGPKGLWADPETKVIMLMPKQLDPSWLNSTQQLPSVIRLDHMVVAADDLSSGRVFEQPIQGNTANPYIYHVPVGPSSAFPSGSGGPPSLTGIVTHFVDTLVNTLSSFAVGLFESPTTMPPAASPPTPVSAGSNNAKYILQTKEKLPANAPCYLRWHQPAAQLNYHAYYTFYIGQVRLDVKATMVEVYLDVSTNGDRTSWKKLMTRSLFSFDDVAQEPGFMSRWLTHTMVAEDPAHDRGLLFLPYRRNQILLYSSAGRSCVIPVNNKPKRVEGPRWDITRSDYLAVKVQTPAPGRFQIQRCAFVTGGVTLQTQKLSMLYTPASPPTITLAGDQDESTSIVAVRSQDPTSYTLPEPIAETRPPTPAGSLTGDQRSVYGIEVTLNASSDGRFTPFLYAVRASSLPTFTASAATPETIDNTSPGTAIASAKVSFGEKPGDGRLTVELWDHTPFPLADKYYRAGYPVRLTGDGGSVLFTGITRPQEVTPLKLSTSRPRRMTLTARDMWQLLEEIHPPDNRDWLGTGHITTVLAIMKMCGVDVTTADTPPLTAQWNTPLGGIAADERRAEQDGGDVDVGWQVKPGETAAGFIKRIAENFSGWSVGFDTDGVPYYLPLWVTPGVPYSATPSYTFLDTSSGTSMNFSNFTTTTEEPEAVVIAVVAGDETDGSLRASRTFVDWAAIRNPAAFNFVSGRWKAEVVKVRGTYSTSQLDLIARRIWDRTRRRRVIAEFEANFVVMPRVGEVATLGSYGDYMILSGQVEYQHEGNGRGSFTAELVHRGF